MADNLLVDILVPDIQKISVDILAPETGMSVENVAVASNISVDIVQEGALSLDFITGGVKGDKGDPGGVTTTKVSGQPLGGQRVVILANDGFLYYASSFTENHCNKVLGITTAAFTSGANTTIQLMDVMEESSWNWTPDLPIFLGDNGLLTQNEDATGIFILQIGVALTATKIYIDKQFPLFK